MQKLVRGVHDFQKNIFRSHEEFFGRLARGQQPEALFVACSDSRINPNLLTLTPPGDLFILRNAGNLVPPWGALYGGEAATVEYAVTALDVRDVIVCGHTDCGAMKALVDPRAAEEMPAVRRWLDHAETTRRILKEKYGDVSDRKALVEAAVQENVLVQLENLRTHPAIAAALAKKALHLHGWIYRLDDGQVLAYEPEHEQFAPLVRPAVETTAPVARRRHDAPTT